MVAGKKKRSKTLPALLFIILLVAAIGLYKIWGPNTGTMHSGNYLYIKTGSVYGDVVTNMQTNGFISDIWSFQQLAKIAGYPAHVHAGRYKIDAGMSNYEIIRLLRSGKQEPVKLVIKIGRAHV